MRVANSSGWSLSPERSGLLEALARLVQAAAQIGLWIAWPLTPIGVALVRRDAGVLRRYFGTLRRCARMIRAMGAHDVVRRNTLRKLRGGDESGRAIVGSCTHCGRCCIDGECVFLVWRADRTSACSVYGTRFFRWTSCGEYPMRADDIAQYRCPSFRVTPAPRRIIPIRTHGQQPQSAD